MEKKDRADIKSMTPDELKREMEELDGKSFRAAQVYEWIHKKLATSFDDMSNLPRELRERLKERYELTGLKEALLLTSELDGTKKFVFELSDGNRIESVWMRYKHGNSVCISSQSGCRMGCRFCASTLDGLARSLRPSEMLEQVYAMTRSTGERVSNIVVMGMGEPLDNYDNLIRFLHLISDENGLNISQRNITVSTCGLAPQMRRFSEEGLSVTLALSLHAPDDEKRKTLMPVANRYTVRETVDACRYYFKRTGRRVTFEYSLIRGENDSQEDAQKLAALLKGLPCHVNLIPVNPIRERDFRESGREAVRRFQNELEKYSINVTIRREMGRDIDASCGQLRRRIKAEKAERKEGAC